MKQKLQETHQPMREFMDVGQEHQKTYYDRSRYRPSHRFGDEALVFNPMVKMGETRKFISFYRGSYTIVKIIDDLNFKVEEKRTN